MSDSMVLVKKYMSENMLPINKNEVWRYSGYMGLTDNIDEQIQNLLDEVIDELRGKLSYRVCFRRLNISFEKGELTIPFSTSSKDLAKCLKGCNEVIIFAATIGLEIDRYIAKYQRFSPTKALLIQALGAERVEKLCDVFCAEYKKQAESEKMFTTKRYSPGYGDLPLEAQKDVFRLLDCNKYIGISLGNSLLMTPSKSVTAIFGLKNKTKNNDDSICVDNENDEKCNQCTNVDCEYRR